MKKLLVLFLCAFPFVSFADTEELIANAEQLYDATRLMCAGISDEISKVSNISKVNTAVTAAGTVAAGGALYAGIKKSQEEEEIEALIEEMCAKGGCDPDKVEAMDDATFFETVIEPYARIAELQEKIEQSKKLGNWRTGLLAGTIGTNLASAIISGINTNQSDLIQHISACNEMVKRVPEISTQLNIAGVNPMEHDVVNKLRNVSTWCNKIDTHDIEKIENRMKGVMGTSIAGTVIGAVGVGTSAAANSDKYMDLENKVKLSEEDKKKEHALNTTANVMAGANVATGAVETGLNISLISLTKKLIASAERCEETLK